VYIVQLLLAPATVLNLSSISSALTNLADEMPVKYQIAIIIAVSVACAIEHIL